MSVPPDFLCPDILRELDVSVMEKSYTEEFNNWSDIGNEADEAAVSICFWTVSNEDVQTPIKQQTLKSVQKCTTWGTSVWYAWCVEWKVQGEYRINMVQRGRLEIHTHLVLSTI